MSPFIIKIMFHDGERTIRDSWVPGNDVYHIMNGERLVRSIVILRRK